MTIPTQVSGYDLHTEIVLGGCMRGRRQDTELTLFGSGLMKSDLPPRNLYPEIYEGIMTVLKDPVDVPTPENVWVATGRKVDLQKLQDMRQASLEKSQESLNSSAKNVMRLADRTETHKVVQHALTDLLDESIPSHDIRTKLQVALARTRAPELQPADVGSILDRWQSKIGSGLLEPITTTNPWLRFVTNGGFRQRRLFGIAGADKSRKTTLARNIILSLVRKLVIPENPIDTTISYKMKDDISVAILAYENDQETTLWDFIVMLAFERMWASGQGRETVNSLFRGMPLHYYLNTELVMTAIDNGSINKFPNTFQFALEWAIEEVKRLPIHIYDSNPANGGLKTDDDMTRVFNMHHAVTGDGKKNVALVDYNGLIQTPGRSAYEGQTEVVARQLYAANAMDYAIIALAQYSRGYQTAQADNKKMTTVGTDNSPALERSVHNYWEVKYDENTPQCLTVKQVRARRSSGGTNSKMYKDFWIQQSTGVIIGDYTKEITPLSNY